MLWAYSQNVLQLDEQHPLLTVRYPLLSREVIEFGRVEYE